MLSFSKKLQNKKYKQVVHKIKEIKKSQFLSCNYTSTLSYYSEYLSFILLLPYCN